MNGLRWTPLAAVAVIAAGCGSGGSYGSASSPASAASGAVPARAPALKVKATSLGKVIVDGKGRTLYMFGADTKNKSNCAGACAQNWPPAAAPRKPKVGSGLSAKKLRVIKRADGTKQLSYAGHPLYRFAGDSSPGDVNGQGINAFGGVWNVVSPKGKAVTSGSSPSSGSTSGQTPSPPAYPRSGGY